MSGDVKVVVNLSNAIVTVPGGQTVAVSNPSATAAASYSPTSAVIPLCGMYKPAANQLGFSANGALVALITTLGLTVAGAVNATSFVGPLTGNVTGNVSGNAATATNAVYATSAGTAALASAVTTNANFTGPITSLGNATSVANQTGTGSVFVMQASPTLTTPNIGAATGVSLALSAIAALTTAAESWVGPSSTTGVYFKGGFVGIGTATPTMGALQVTGGAPFTVIPGTTSAIGQINLTGLWTGQGFLFSGTTNDAFSMVYTGGVAYFGKVTNSAAATLFTVTSTGFQGAIGATTPNTVAATTISASSLVSTPASTAARAGLRIVHGAAPTTPLDGDIWTTTAGMFIRVSGVTKTVTLT